MVEDRGGLPKNERYPIDSCGSRGSSKMSPAHNPPVDLGSKASGRESGGPCAGLRAGGHEIHQASHRSKKISRVTKRFVGSYCHHAQAKKESETHGCETHGTHDF